MGWVRRALLALSVLLFGLHFLHLSADFPAGTDWTDWSRFTDEGWYSDAAVRHVTLGHWYMPGEFNPAVAMPVWPLLLLPAFAVFGRSVVVARGLMVVVFGLGLLGVWRLLETSRDDAAEEPALAGPLAVFLLAASPFCFAFSREAVLEPLLVTLTVWALVAAGRLQTVRWAQWALGLLLPAMVLTKPTALALLPAVVWMAWARVGYRWRALVRVRWLPGLVAAVIWMGYLLLFVRPHYLEDYRYLFVANEYTGFQSDPLWQVLYWTVGNAVWIGAGLCAVFVLVLAWIVLGKPQMLRRPLVPSLLVWIVGYLAFLGYHNNLQARYYLLLEFPVTMLVAIGLEAFCFSPGVTTRQAVVRVGIATVCVLAIAVPDFVEEIGFALHPAYTYMDAARRIAAIVRADKEHSPSVLSVSGSDLDLMVGLPSVNTEFSTLDLDQLVALYRPGWYVTWNQVDDEDLKGIAPLYRLEPVASFPAMDDPDRNVLLLYRLEPRR